MGRFFIGAATAAHQVEGDNIHSDYWLMEHLPHTSFAEPSGRAVDHYHRYQEDIDLLADAGLNAYRFSIEWARIEPEEGKFDEAEIEHYRSVIRYCKQRGVEPIVTLMHFTSPAWLIRKGGWENPGVVEDFAKYCSYVVKELGNELSYVCTINEANMRLQVSAIAAMFQKQMMAKAALMQQAASGERVGGEQTEQKSREEENGNGEGMAQVGMNFRSMMENRRLQEAENLEAFGTKDPACFVSACTKEGDELVMQAHRAAREAIKKIHPTLKVGLTLSLHDLQVVEGGEDRAKKEWEDEFSHYLKAIRDDDFFGLQNYSCMKIGPEGSIPVEEGVPVTQMGYANYPQALEHVIRKVHVEFAKNGIQMPILVTENGIATAKDEERQAFIKEALAGVHRCMEDGIVVKGYFYWSLLDNFEWQRGFSMTFGLVGVDRNSMEREPKESLQLLGKLAGSNW